MDSKIYVGSIETLEALERLLSSFAASTTDAIEAFGRESQRRIDIIDEYCADCQRSLDRWDAEYESADDEEDDIEYLAFKRDEAQEKLAQAQHWQRRIEESNENFVRSARRVMAISTGRLMEAQSFLRRKTGELYDYTEYNLDNGAVGYAGSHGKTGMVSDSVHRSLEETVATVENRLDDFEKIALPQGFSWVKINEISGQELNELPKTEDFRKGVSPEDMKKGFEILRTDILPVFRQTPHLATVDYFEEFDRKHHRNSTNSAKKIFNVFFGKAIPEHIRLERISGSDYGITNGRHRIKIARDLGWTCIPAEAIEIDLDKR